MLASFYYFIGLFLLLLNIVVFFNLKKYFLLKEFFRKFKKVTNKDPEFEDFPVNIREVIKIILLVEICNFFWSFIGIISSNWIIFLFYLIVIPILSFIINKSKNNLVTNFFILTKVLVSILIIGLLIFNHFHFKLNLTNLILN